MKNNEYWQERFIELEKAMNSYGQEAYREIEPAFNNALREVNKSIEKWIYRIAENNEISMVSAKKWLDKELLEEFKWDVSEYIKRGKENAVNQRWVKELENASARYHISKLEALKIEIQQQMELAFGNELDDVDKLSKLVYKEGYYRSGFEIQRGLGIGYNLASIDENKLSKLISKPWAADGKNFSDRIWQSKDSMINDLNQEMTRTCILGKAPDEAIKHLSQYADKKFKNVKMQAGRLVMTEQAFFSSAAQKDCFNELGVQKFEIVATLDSHTSEVCQEMDGKHFPMKDYEPGVTAPPFHVWCRSVTVPYFDDEFTADDMRAARDENGKYYEVPADMKYEEWKKKFVDNTRENVIMKVAKEVGLTGVIDVNPYSIDVKEYSFDDKHINRERGHNITREEAEGIISSARVSLTRWNGRFINYFSEKGAVYVDTQKESIRTAYKKEQFDDKTIKFMEVVMQHEEK